MARKKFVFSFVVLCENQELQIAYVHVKRKSYSFGKSALTTCMCHNGKRERELESKATFSDDVGNVNACAAGWRITVLFKLFHCSVVFRSLYTTRSLPPRQLDYVFLVDFVVISALLLFVARRVARAFLPSMWIYLCIFFSFFLPRSKILCNLRANGEKILRKNNKGTRCKIYVQTHALPYHYPYKNKHFKASGITKSRCCVEEKKHSETKIITCLQFKNFCLTRVFCGFVAAASAAVLPNMHAFACILFTLL